MDKKITETRVTENDGIERVEHTERVEERVEKPQKTVTETTTETEEVIEDDDL